MSEEVNRIWDAEPHPISRATYANWVNSDAGGGTAFADVGLNQIWRTLHPGKGDRPKNMLLGKVDGRLCFKTEKAWKKIERIPKPDPEEAE
jgi:hypothetical protein